MVKVNDGTKEEKRMVVGGGRRPPHPTPLPSSLPPLPPLIAVTSKAKYNYSRKDNTRCILLSG